MPDPSERLHDAVLDGTTTGTVEHQERLYALRTAYPLIWEEARNSMISKEYVVKLDLEKRIRTDERRQVLKTLRKWAAVQDGPTIWALQRELDRIEGEA